MSDKIQRVPAASLSRLLNVLERKLEQLAKDGVIPKPVRGQYELVNSVRGYVAHLQKSASGAMDQAAVARHLDMSDRNLRDVMRGLGLDWPADTDDIRIAYIRDLREKAAGRGGDDNLSLTRAKSRESRLKGDKLEMEIGRDADQLVDAAEMERAWCAMITAARVELSSMAARLQDTIKNDYGVDIPGTIIDEHIDRSLKHLAGSGALDAEQCDDDGAEIVGETTESIDDSLGE